MSERRHTPGSWTINGLAIEGSDHSVICLMGHPAQCGGDTSSNFPNDKANAHLIAAAPDLLEALEKVIRDLDDDPYTAPTLEGAYEAIARAKGDTP